MDTPLHLSKVGGRIHAAFLPHVHCLAASFQSHLNAAERTTCQQLGISSPATWIYVPSFIRGRTQRNRFVCVCRISKKKQSMSRIGETLADLPKETVLSLIAQTQTRFCFYLFLCKVCWISSAFGLICSCLSTTALLGIHDTGPFENRWLASLSSHHRSAVCIGALDSFAER